MSDDRSGFAETHSVTRIIERLKVDDPNAASELWRKFFERLLPRARARLRGHADHAIDAEDLLVSVFDRFFRAVRENRFARLNDRDDLWQILLLLTDRRIVDHYRRGGIQRRGAGMTVSECDVRSSPAEGWEVMDDEFGPEYVAAFNDQLSAAIGRLNDEKTRAIALLKLEGYENRDIARQLELSLSSVERKLRVVREVWSREFSAEKSREVL